MDAGLTAMTVAAVGVVGTLLSPVLAQRSVARASRLAAEMDRELRRDERDAANQRSKIEERRTEYTALNALARTCRNEVKACARRHPASRPEDLTAVRDAWLSYQDRYDSAQMILPDEVLELASTVNRLLAQGYRQLQTLASTGAPTPEAIVEFCNGPILDKLAEMRQAMREDLGVSRSSEAPRQRIVGVEA
ncbi:hypothetical protein V6V47_15700 [Micromonospora sp. CPCC 205539]|uniref:hypothetical protein n=1 Tax=Micromonospora sp. CPCC 205539 TaxID=3122408 RepID=UPI002FF3DEDA